MGRFFLMGSGEIPLWHLWWGIVLEFLEPTLKAPRLPEIIPLRGLATLHPNEGFREIRLR